MVLRNQPCEEYNIFQKILNFNLSNHCQISLMDNATNFEIRILSSKPIYGSMDVYICKFIDNFYN